MGAISEYYDGLDKIKEDAGSDDIVKISPSSIERFFSSTSQWYYEEIDGNDKAFQGSTSTYLGTIVHHCAEMAGKGLYDKNTIQNDVKEFINEITDPEVNKAEIETLWEGMADELVNNAVTDDVTFVGQEEFLFSKLKDNIYVGGTYDALIKDPNNSRGLIVRDYKTAARKPTGINRGYRLQAHAYAYMLTEEKGHNITGIELSFITRPSKTMSPRYFSFTEPYTKEDHESIGSLLRLMAESIHMYKTNKDMRNIIAQRPIPPAQKARPVLKGILKR